MPRYKRKRKPTKYELYLEEWDLRSDTPTGQNFSVIGTTAEDAIRKFSKRYLDTACFVIDTEQVHLNNGQIVLSSPRDKDHEWREFSALPSWIVYHAHYHQQKIFGYRPHRSKQNYKRQR